VTLANSGLGFPVSFYHHLRENGEMETSAEHSDSSSLTFVIITNVCLEFSK
jgi:hypothetical protein